MEMKTTPPKTLFQGAIFISSRSPFLYRCGQSTARMGGHVIVEILSAAASTLYCLYHSHPNISFREPLHK
jgi:hypothetical protein